MVIALRTLDGLVRSASATPSPESPCISCRHSARMRPPDCCNINHPDCCNINHNADTCSARDLTSACARYDEKCGPRDLSEAAQLHSRFGLTNQDPVA
jgi:hypothetical protein